MDLWIRSQDKTIFQKVDNLLISDGDNAEGTFNIYTNSLPVQNVLGIYKTKERALEVLDEIYKLLIPKPIISTYNVEQAELLGGTTFIKPMLDDIKVESYTPYIYQMPEN